MKDTSKEAYEQIKPHLSEQQNKVISLLIHLGGNKTSEQIANYYLCVLTYEAVKKRMGELEKLGIVRDSGKRAKTSSGRNAIVWEIVDKSSLK